MIGPPFFFSLANFGEKSAKIIFVSTKMAGPLSFFSGKISFLWRPGISSLVIFPERKDSKNTTGIVCTKMGEQ